MSTPELGKSSIDIVRDLASWMHHHRWTTALAVGLCLAPIAAWMALAGYAPLYQASALIMIEEAAPHIAFDGASVASRSSAFVQTQLEILRSPLVLQPALNDPKIASQPEISESSDPMETLRSDLAISRLGQSELYNLSYTARDAQISADVANAIVIQYLTVQQSGERERTNRVVDLLERERLMRRVVVERLRKEVQRLGEEVTGHDPFFKSRVTDLSLSPVSNNVAAVYDALTKVELELIVVQAQLASLEGAQQDGELVKSAADGQSNNEVPAAMASWKAALDDLRAIADEVTEFDDEPNGKSVGTRLDAIIERQQASLDQIRQHLAADAGARQTPEQLATNREQIANLELQLLTAKKDALEKRLYDLIKKDQGHDSDVIELLFKQADLKREEKIFEMIASRSLAIQTESRTPARVTLKQEATPPIEPINRPPYDWAVVAGALAMLLPFGVASLIGPPPAARS
jgi:uncharacterized protein involved in exopolysaccharide biosynthesis